MQRSSSRGSTVTVAAISFAVAAVVAVGAFSVVSGPADPGKPQPTFPPLQPLPTPTVRPTFPPIQPLPTPTPSAPTQGHDEIDLDTAGGHDVRVIVTDDSGDVVGGRSGRAGDGMSIRWGDVDIVNVDADTIRLTWAGFPRDEVVQLAVSSDGDQVSVLIVQDAPYPNTDAMGADRVLILDFDREVDADDVVAEVEASRDTDD